jgi:hypothetical protein
MARPLQPRCQLFLSQNTEDSPKGEKEEPVRSWAPRWGSPGKSSFAHGFYEVGRL